MMQRHDIGSSRPTTRRRTGSSTAAWATTLLDRVLGLLAQEYAQTGRADVFDRLKVVLSQGKGAVPAAELAAQLGTTEGAVHTAVHRLKKRYRAILQQEIAATLDDPSDGG